MIKLKRKTRRLIKKNVEAGLISVRKHSDDPELTIYNYTPETAFSRAWDDATLMCRGLILHSGKRIVARPFPKFFNYGEVPFERFEGLSFKAYEKFDGSLGIGYIAPDGSPAISTRGSFHSKQATWATAWLRKNPEARHFVLRCTGDNFTPLFEIIYRENKIVVDYGNREELVLIAVIDNATGKDVGLDYPGWPGAIATAVDSEEDMTVDGLRALEVENAEGFVLLYENGERLKVKFEEYLRLHKLVTGLTEGKIWEMLQSVMGQSFTQVRDMVPDEFYNWMTSVKEAIEKHYAEIEQSALSTLSQVDRSASRKEQAQFILNHPHSGIVFKMLDNAEYREQIWKMVKPVANKPYVEEV